MRLREWRQENHLSLRDLSQKLNISKQQAWRYELGPNDRRGQAAPPRIADRIVAVTGGAVTFPEVYHRPPVAPGGGVIEERAA